VGFDRVKKGEKKLFDVDINDYLHSCSTAKRRRKKRGKEKEKKNRKQIHQS
jgi:hypothetical protein